MYRNLAGKVDGMAQQLDQQIMHEKDAIMKEALSGDAHSKILASHCQESERIAKLVKDAAAPAAERLDSIDTTALISTETSLLLVTTLNTECVEERVFAASCSST